MISTENLRQCNIKYGRVSIEEINFIGLSLSESDIDFMIKHTQTDGRGNVSYEDLRNLLRDWLNLFDLKYK